MGYVIAGLFIGLMVIWLIGVFKLNDFSIKRTGLKDFNKILVVFPHPDDEVLLCGGLINRAVKEKREVTLVILSKGEAGGDGKQREKEMKESARILGVTNLIQKDFGDGKIRENSKEVKQFLENLMEKEKAELVVTYDLAGLYGHEDHMATTEIVTEILNEKFPRTKLWYTAQTKSVLGMITLPDFMAKDKNYSQKRAKANIRLFVGREFFAKMKALRAHGSQYKSFRSSVPQPWPLPYVYSMQLWEYFEEVEKRKI